MVSETYGATINLNQQQGPQTTQMEHQQSNMPIPSAPLSVKTPWKDLFLWEVAGIQVSFQVCCGILQK